MATLLSSNAHNFIRGMGRKMRRIEQGAVRHRGEGKLKAM
jgi:hypothetical protein